MADRQPLTPPRPLKPGDIITAYSDVLGAWTAAQITDVDPGWKTAGVLELDWSGSEPPTLRDLVSAEPLRLTHHSWTGQLSYVNYEWVLPRSYQVIGSLPLIHDRPSGRYGAGWQLGEQLDSQRRWDSGDHESSQPPGSLECTGADLNDELAAAASPRRDIRKLKVTAIESLDCGSLAARFPELTYLSLDGKPGTLLNASQLNQLTRLKTLFMKDLFGMEKSDCLRSDQATSLEMLSISSIPADYAAAMRSTWRPEVVHGTYVQVSAPRKPEWVAENMNNPLRDWDGRNHITSAKYRKSVAQYKLTRQAIFDALSDDSDRQGSERLVEIGRQFGDAFNKIDGRNQFIETEEREELFIALDAIVTEAEQLHAYEFPSARGDLASGVDSVRNW